MAVPSGSCSLTPIEMAELNSWSFIKSYQNTNNQQDLLDLAKPLYTILCHSVNNQPPTQDEFCKAYASSLLLTNLYVKRIAGTKYYLPLTLYKYFAELLAKYVVDQDWKSISSAPCP